MVVSRGKRTHAVEYLTSGASQKFINGALDLLESFGATRRATTWWRGGQLASVDP